MYNIHLHVPVHVVQTLYCFCSPVQYLPTCTCLRCTNVVLTLDHMYNIRFLHTPQLYKRCIALVYLYNIHLPAHALMTQTLYWLGSPKQYFPPGPGIGLVQSLCLLVIPVPQLTEHIDQLPQTVQLPLTR